MDSNRRCAVHRKESHQNAVTARGGWGAAEERRSNSTPLSSPYRRRTAMYGSAVKWRECEAASAVRSRRRRPAREGTRKGGSAEPCSVLGALQRQAAPRVPVQAVLTQRRSVRYISKASIRATTTASVPAKVQ